LIYDKVTGKLFNGLLWDVTASGQSRAEVHFKDGRRHGRSVEWHPDGSKSLEGEWSEGVPKGTVTEWSADGLLREETTYGKNGQVVKSETVPSEKLQGRATAAVAQRDKMDRTVWKGEIQAQEYESTFIGLWDHFPWIFIFAQLIP
jgi:antitoxin component YwqK of YwqJK toxin-antitoxin module